ncbi:MAG: hypothetical protein LBL07_09230 [Tannerella sp.]|jgi:hypothetical protein|nr:hypothetical protein [Tannerella sp.]
MEELLMGGTSMFLFRQGSRNSLNIKRFDRTFLANYEYCFGMRLPHQDTVADVLTQVDPDSLESVKMNLMSRLFEQKWLRPYRLLGHYYLVAVDATGVVSFDKPHCEHCLTKKSKSGKVTYFHYVLEAKLVTPSGHCLSLASEWVENPSGDFNKQDCELKAFARLADKLKKQYPRLPVCILADGLYPNNTVFDICQSNDWKYILVLQDTMLKSVQEEVDLIRLRKPVAENYRVKSGVRISSKYRFQTAIPYKKHHLHWMQCVETKTKDVPSGVKNMVEPVTSTFEYVTNIEPDRENVISLTAGGRLRWKIENEGFNTQKCGDYELEHKYCRNSYSGMKNYYTLLQIAHLINQLVEKSKFVTTLRKEHSKQTIREIWRCLIAYMLCVRPGGTPKVQPSG